MTGKLRTTHYQKFFGDALKRLLVVILKFGGLFFVATLTADIAFSADRFVPYEDGAGLVLELSSEDRRPYVRSGEKLPFIHYLMYIHEIEEFESVTDCLETSERQKLHPDLTQFEWAKVDSIRALEVCMFRVAASYAGPDEMLNWLSAQGIPARISIRPKYARITGSVKESPENRPRATPSGDVVVYFLNPLNKLRLSIKYHRKIIKSVKITKSAK